MRLESPVIDPKHPMWQAPAFELPDPSGKRYTLDNSMGPTGAVIAFICNHCPYVQAVIDRFVSDAAALKKIGINTVAIMANDYDAYPEDNPDAMLHFAEQHGFIFPYLVDKTQEVARAYTAVCTPDFFGFNADKTLVYRGRLDDAKRGDASHRVPELRQAMKLVSETGRGPDKQYPSLGCSIKWRS